MKLQWNEGDVAGFSAIRGGDGEKVVGFVEYHQKRTGEHLETHRVAHFADGSSDEDVAEATVDGTLNALRGRSIIRDKDGNTVVDLDIDVSGGRIRGSVGAGDAKRPVDQQVNLPAGTYWGPLVFIVLKNFDANAERERLVFRTVAPTPQPRVIDMELVRTDRTTVPRVGSTLSADRFRLRPTINWMVDPIIRLIAPDVDFYVAPGAPPALVRFVGPRNYAGQKIELE